jgi:hypothetical protein
MIKWLIIFKDSADEIESEELFVKHVCHALCNQY